MARYLNPWHKPNDASHGPRFYETEAKPAEYKGFKIYHVHNMRFDCVIDEAGGPICKTQRAGINGAHRYIDEFWAKQNGA